MPPAKRQHMWFMHDWAPPHDLRTLSTWTRLSVNSGKETEARSTGLHNSLDFWLWKHLKASVCSAPINDLEVLLQRVDNACQGIRVKPGIFYRLRTSVPRRTESCVEINGNYTEHLLWRSYEHRPYLIRHWLVDKCWLRLFCSFN
jgi:hypothetical protein